MHGVTMTQLNDGNINDGDVCLSLFLSFPSFSSLRLSKTVRFSIFDETADVLICFRCFSALGHIGGQQPLSLGNGCFRHGTIMHEFLHAFGFYHEQMRTDRDDYILVNYDNIIPGITSSFQRLQGALGHEDFERT